MNWLDVVDTLNNKFDFDAFVTACEVNAVPSGFNEMSYPCTLGRIMSMQAKTGGTLAEAYSAIIAADRVTYKSENKSSVSNCCGGGTVR